MNPVVLPTFLSSTCCAKTIILNFIINGILNLVYINIGTMEDPNQIKFSYKVIYCSGEDPKYPVTELLDPTVNSKGWQS